MLFAGCSEPGPTAYEQEILSDRRSKDQTFFDPETSILPAADRPQFMGLTYYPVDSTFRYVLPLNPAETIEIVNLPAQNGDITVYERIGSVSIPGPNGETQLSVFRGAEHEDGEAWIPFRDATSNRETYGGGRYLDVELTSNGVIEVDFNRAYNPYCAYNPVYICALPPRENYLPFAMRVGEKQFAVGAGGTQFE